MDDRSRSRRRLALVLIAIVAPSAAILGLGVQLLLQENRLDESRRTELFETAFRDFAQGLDAVRIEPPDSAVVLRAPVLDGRLRFTWMSEGPPDMSGAFGRLIGQGEQSEFVENAPARAAARYVSALAAADSPRQQATALLSLMRANTRAGRVVQADSARFQVARMDPGLTDEYGVPFSLYAVSTIQDRGRQLNILAPHLGRGLSTSTSAAYLYRSLRDSLRGPTENPAFKALDAFVEASITAVRLQDDFASLYPLLASRPDGVTPWLLYGGDGWLLTLDAEGQLLVLDSRASAGTAAQNVSLRQRGFLAPTLSSSSTLPNRFLGAQFTGIYARMESAETSPVGPSRLRLPFIGLTALLVIGLLTMAVVLMSRDARRELETARLRSDFVSNVSHELKTPLTSIRMYAETLRLRRQDDAVRDEYLDTIVSESGRLTRLLNNVLDFARVEKGTQRFAKSPVSLQRAVEAGLEALSHVIRADGFKVKTTLPEEPVMVQADPDALEQVVLNLLSNAFKYSGASRYVAVGVGRNGSTASLTIEDRGLGIAAEDLPQLFEPYFRAKQESGPRVAGTGLGLSIVKHTVDAHGGTIAVDSRPGEGTSVTVTLPMA